MVQSGPTSTNNTVESLQNAILNNIKFFLLKDQFNRNNMDCYLALARTVRDQLVDQWIQTKQTYHRYQAKRVYYLSLEYLIGRSTVNNIINLGLDKEFREAVHRLGMNFQAISELENDAGLGNGGLGRLAACFMDSLATLEIPAVGYGLRYDYGIFQQKIINGYQVEQPDSWLHLAHSWEIHRPEYTIPVHFGGRVESYIKEGKKRSRWISTQVVHGVPYDMPITGYRTNTINTLRLWSARAMADFDLHNFNKGSYAQAVQEKIEAENITKVLYPNDNTYEGKELRFRQQYFFASCSIQDIIRRFSYENNRDFSLLYEKASIHLNDTHPALAVLELMRILVDEKDLEWDVAWKVCQACFAYTNHTLLPEALERWPVELFEKWLPRHLEIVYEINHRFLDILSRKYPNQIERAIRMSLVEEKPLRQIRMAYLSVIGSHSINGVSALHTELLEKTLLKDFYDLYPERFNNKTNGVTPRRWLISCNPGLTELINSTIGTQWHKNLAELRALEKYVENAEFRKKFREVKLKNKQRLADYIFKRNKIFISPQSLFDVQVKRLHEYKRQLLNLLHIVILYNRLRKDPNYEMVPRTFIFGAKAAPGYFMAKLIIKLINDVAITVNKDIVAENKLKVVFLENYDVSLAEIVFPGSDLSEQISTAGFEASGTGNMKFMMNGALTIGTLDGANVEIKEEVGEENIFIFGLTVQKVEALKHSKTYSPKKIYEASPEIREALDLIFNDYFNPQEPNLYEPIHDMLFTKGDYFLNLADLESYAITQLQVDELYRNPEEWTKKAILNVARCGKFSTDRTISEYAQEIWKTDPVKITLK